MAVTASWCNSYQKECMDGGIHTSSDTYKIALYNSATATLNQDTTVYTTTGEISGTGYTAGGMVLTNFATVINGGKVILDFSDASWTNATITADTALIYNSSKSNKAVAVISMTPTTSTNGTFSVPFGTPDATNATLRIA